MIRQTRAFLIVQVNRKIVQNFNIKIHISITDSQNFSEELNPVAEEAGRKELETSITETKLDDGETLIDNLGLNDSILDTDKNVSDACSDLQYSQPIFSQIADCQEAGVATQTAEVTEAIGKNLN